MARTATATETVTYWRTGKGSHKHENEWCANGRRSIFTGDILVIPANEADAWPACEHCCSTETIRKTAEAAAKKADEMCANTGVANPRRIQSTCNDCGKLGSVNRSTGKLRGHKVPKK